MATTKAHPITRVPNEVLSAILCSLEVKDLVSMLQVCKHIWSNLSNNEMLWAQFSATFQHKDKKPDDTPWKDYFQKTG